MRLSDIMAEMDLTIWPEIAIVIFLVAFAAIAVRTFGKKNQRAIEEASKLPLED